MFRGHFAPAMAAKKIAPKASLGALVLSAQFADCLWPVLLLLGLEQVRIAPGITRLTQLDFTPIPSRIACCCSWCGAFCSAALGSFPMKFWRMAGAVFVPL
jgi:hypothetical protein